MIFPINFTIIFSINFTSEASYLPMTPNNFLIINKRIKSYFLIRLSILPS